MKKVLILSAMLVLALSLPTFAAYQVNWAENFDSYATGVDLNGLSDWRGTAWETAGSAGYGVGTTAAQSLSYANSIQQVPNTTSRAAKNVQAGGPAFKRGRVQAWMYVDESTYADTRVGAYSDMGHDSISKMVTANITSATSSAFFRAQWSWSHFTLDGTAGNSTTTGYSFTAGPAAPILTGWNKVRIDFGYSYAGDGSVDGFWAKWFININPTSELTLTGYNLYLNVDTATARLANMGSGMQGIMVGAHYLDRTNPVHVDDVEFKGNVIPEPTSLLALGTGLVGLAGLIRRKR